MKLHTKTVLIKKASFLTTITAFALISMYSCSGGQSSQQANTSDTGNTPAASRTTTFDTLEDKGVGPVTSVTMGAINADSAAKGETIFKSKCSACHKLDQRLVGPALMGVTARRSPEWIMNQILNPAEQDQKDPIGQALLAKYMTQMTFQNVTQADARDILEYLRSASPEKK